MRAQVFSVFSDTSRFSSVPTIQLPKLSSSLLILCAPNQYVHGFFLSAFMFLVGYLRVCIMSGKSMNDVFDLFLMTVIIGVPFEGMRAKVSLSCPAMAMRIR